MRVNLTGGFRSIGHSVEYDREGKLLTRKIELPDGWVRHIVEVIDHGDKYEVHFKDTEVIRFTDF